MIGELWWTRLVNSVRFIDDVCDALLDGKSVMLMFKEEIPWRDIMVETIEQKLLYNSDVRTVDTIDDSSIENSPADYVLNNYCTPKEVTDYWPLTHQSVGNYLARFVSTAFNSRYLCITGVKNSKNRAAEWITLAADYIENIDSSQETGQFIFVVEDAGVTSSKHFTVFNYEDYVTDYDCMMLCLTMVSELSCSRAEKMYLCEVASNIANNNVEYAALLVSEKTELIKHPQVVAKRVYRENGFDTEDLNPIVETALWEAQISLVFPKIESYRTEIIRKYGKKLRKYLPIQGFYGEVVDNVEDLEIGQLYYICYKESASPIVSKAENDMLFKMREARNLLAHCDILSYNQLKELEVI